MDLEQLKSHWNKSKKNIEENYTLNQKEMETIIKKQSDTTTQGLSRIFMMGIVVQSLTIIFQLVSLLVYKIEMSFALAIVGSLAIVIPTLFYSINRYRLLKSADYNSLSLAESLRQKIDFYKFSHNKWLLSFAISFVIFMWSINILTGDFISLQGFSIKLILLYAAVFLVIYFSYRYAHTKYLKEYEISLMDLGGQHLTDLHKESRKFRIFKIILISILSLVLVVGLVVLFMR